MIKLKGSALSTEAAGKLADVLTFAKSKKGTYAKKHAAPAQPRTAPQIGVRAAIHFLSRQWSSLSIAQMDTWYDRAQQTHIANYHAYISYNQKRCSNFQAPSKEDPAAEASGPPTRPILQLTTGVKMVYVKVVRFPPEPTWGWVIFRSPTALFTPSPHNTIALIFSEPFSGQIYHDTPVDAGTYYYRARGFNDDATLGELSTEKTITLP